MKIEVGKTYKTNSGTDVEIVYEDKTLEAEYPFLGVFYPPGEICINCLWFDRRGRALSYKMEIIINGEPNVPWSTFPPYFRWFVQSPTGNQFMLTERPIIKPDRWTASRPFSAIRIPDEHKIPFNGDWRDSLTERPED